jgi:hypothetical protein
MVVVLDGQPYFDSTGRPDASQSRGQIMLQLSESARVLLDRFDEATFGDAYQQALSEAVDAAERAVEVSKASTVSVSLFREALLRGQPDKKLCDLAARAEAATRFHCAMAFECRQEVDAFDEAIAWLNEQSSARWRA